MAAWNCAAKSETPLHCAPSSAAKPYQATLTGSQLEDFVRHAATTYWHPCGTAKMCQDSMSVVDSALRVYGIDNLRIADASVMPRITTGNTMAPCVAIGERAADMLINTHAL